ncbi:related to histone deacetylase SIR2 [Ramularia collo-cygni]|uniref:Related to histone deacetylase SIR2 n=1 Tax=Ramularia collo-cygni TaxID=112498 RepID=A0A2D3VNZ8_9PEZI|nr:related to histone deacetylase SIR2 [Ramularia collo-cygni]CZT24724.1 related to histone deacetylase SIR2 [Ramularia collo-cygni]
MPTKPSAEDDDSESFINDYADYFEMAPYQNDGELGLSTAEIKALRDRLMEMGPVKFLEEVVENEGVDPRRVGIVFNLDPDLDIDEADFLKLLGCTIARTYWKRKKLPEYNTIDDAANLLKSCKNILVITGAGISTSLGIPDFRSKDNGFYTKLVAMGYFEPEEVFDIHTFDDDPSVFYNLAGDILPDEKQGISPTHAFIRLLQDKDRLQTNYSQNIDNLEALAGIHDNRLIQCHGSFATASCRRCKVKVPGNEIFAEIRNKEIARCKRCIEEISETASVSKRPQKRSKLNDSDDSGEDDDIPQPGVMKPDITFFGEQLPNNFFDRFTDRDAQAADLVIVIGTSLKVAPVSEMPNYLPHVIPHIYISREAITHVEFDIQLLGDCDDVVFELCRRAGWSLKHDMIPRGFRTNVMPVEGHGHHWRVTPAVKEIEDSQDFDEQATPELVRRPSTSGAENHTSSAPHLNAMFKTTL